MNFQKEPALRAQILSVGLLVIFVIFVEPEAVVGCGVLSAARLEPRSCQQSISAWRCRGWQRVLVAQPRAS
jgi:hypothetical protein